MNLNKLIYNCNWVLLLFDGLEDQRPLSRLESSLRALVRTHLANLQESKRVYWKQRNTVRWVKFRDENSHFFHSMATMAHKKNFVVSLTQDDGNLITNHEQKANLIWMAFKDRLGISEFTDIAFDLGSLLTPQNLDDLDLDFSQDEIDVVIKDLPSNHAAGLDGFNGLFIKRYWNTVKNDFIRLFRDFHQHNIDLKSINSSVIALIPKKG